MEIGSLGVIENRFFYPIEKGAEKYAYLYLTTAKDVSRQLWDTYPFKTNRRSFFEAQYSLIERETPICCTAIFLGEIIVPDELVSTGPDFASRIQNMEKWKYYKVLLTLGEKTEICFLHEKSASYFNWQ